MLFQLMKNRKRLIPGLTGQRRFRRTSTPSRLSRIKIFIPLVFIIISLALIFPNLCIFKSASSQEPVAPVTQQSPSVESSFKAREVFAIDYYHDMLMESDDGEHKVKKDPMFPADIFTLKQRRQGAVVFHIAGVIYMFVALAIVCDEFFIPALDVITERLGISEDVAGATFMAAGGSAPELFTSLIGVFISHDDVGIGTIVGSAVFNILFVISMCAVFSKESLKLTWWPLFRDVSFYSLILISLMACFKDSWITWYEALIMLTWYGCYVSFMKYNETIEKKVKQIFNRGKVNNIEVTQQRDSIDSKTTQVPNCQYHRKLSAPILHGGSTKFRQGVLHLMIHSIDPLHNDEVIHNCDRPGSAISSRKGHNHSHQLPNCRLCSEEAELRKVRNSENFRNENSGAYHVTTTSLNGNAGNVVVSDNQSLPSVYNPLAIKETNVNPSSLPSQGSIEETEKEPLDVSWPNLWYKKITYVMLAPIVIPLWITLPDVRRPEKKRFVVGSFVGSIVWIAFFSYLMVWWATLVGETFGIPSEVMGLTFLAAGTSIPDLVTSVLVARKGFGDMAVSSSVGSNIFDVTVGLPLPWFLYSIVKGSVKVNSSGMACSILILFLMLIFVIVTIAAFKWRLNIGMALVMFALYFAFIVISLLLEYGVLKCASIITLGSV